LTVLQLFQALDETRARGRRLRAGSRSHRFIDLLHALWRGIAQKGGDVVGQVVDIARRLAGRCRVHERLGCLRLGKAPRAQGVDGAIDMLPRLVVSVVGERHLEAGVAGLARRAGFCGILVPAGLRQGPPVLVVSERGFEPGARLLEGTQLI
jgi:hypothetical protein